MKTRTHESVRMGGGWGKSCSLYSLYFEQLHRNGAHCKGARRELGDGGWLLLMALAGGQELLQEPPPLPPQHKLLLLKVPLGLFCLEPDLAQGV